MKHLSLALAGAVVLGSMAVSLVATPAANAKEVMGKVLAVYHEKVTVNQQVLDKVSVTVRSCLGNPPLETVHYSPGIVSETNDLGHLYRQLLNSARTNEVKNQYMTLIGGHASFDVDDTNKVLKTTIWGYNWECGKNVGQSAASGSGASASAPNAGAVNSSGASAPAAAPAARPSLGGFGIGRFGR